MPKKVYTRTGIAGNTAADRRLLNVGTTGVPTAAPSLSGDGILLQRNEFLHLFFSLTSADAAAYYTLQIWWYSPISSLWHKGETLTINADDVSTIEVQGMDRIYVQVTNVSSTDAATTLEAWLGLVVPV
jgi:hypothetical protein